MSEGQFPLNSQDGKVRVLMVCLGNICRSPTAHGVFQRRLEKRALQDRILVDSAGTGSWHIGSSPDRRAAAAAAGRGYTLEHLKARQVEDADFYQFDYLLAMDHDNLAALEAKRPHNTDCHIELLLEYSDRNERAVPDPYYSGGDGFELVLDMVEEASERLLDALVNRHLSV
ncbi:MAG: low molecular weight protein-tyrosine-phosphatase [Gammaproteobacteria bacterium]|jgi:protein-tyrosine phosphatase